MTEESDVRSEFAHFYKATLESLRCGNFKKNPIKIDEDFFYAAFDPIQHYTLEVITCNIFSVRKYFGVSTINV